MPIHDWSRVPAGIFQDFCFSWIAGFSRLLNGGLLPSDYYAVIERIMGGLSLHYPTDPYGHGEGDEAAGRSEMEIHRRKQNSVVVRRANGDRAVAVVEVVSPANKSTRSSLEEFVRRVIDSLEHRVHLLIIDLIPPGPHDPRGIHGAIRDETNGRGDLPHLAKPLTLAAYESGIEPTAYVEPVAVGDTLPEMPRFLEPGRFLEIPLEDTYRSAWRAFPRRWKDVLESPR